MSESKVENKGIYGTKKNGLWFTGIKKNGLWFIRAARGGVVSTMDKVLDIESYLLDQRVKS